MIPNAVASTGPYAGLWSHLKSIDHALERALTLRGARLTELDRDRLRALIDLLQGGLSDQEAPESARSLLPYSTTAEPSYGATLDLRHRLVNVPQFQDWHKSSKKGIESKIARLIKAVEDYLDRPRTSLFSEETPVEEFEVLRAVLKDLLVEAEAALC